MEVLTTKNMVPYPHFDDRATEHVLMDGPDTIATIKEVSTAPRAASDSPNTKVFFSIDFARVTKTRLPDGRFSYKGLLKIHSAVKDGGHSIFTVQENTGGISMGLRPSLITVTLQSIRCISADDRGGVEEVYGAYGVSAVTGMSPYHANVFSPGAANGTLWQRTASNTLSLEKGQFRNINAIRSFTLPQTGELVLYGDLSEEDENEGGGGKNDRLGESHLERIPVRDLRDGVPRVIEHTYKSGGTVIAVLVTINRKDGLMAPAPVKGNPRSGLGPPHAGRNAGREWPAGRHV